MSRQTTLEIAWWKRRYPILFQLCQRQSSVITAVNSLLTSKGCFILFKKTKQKKIVLYLQMFQHKKLYLSFSKISISALFLKFRKFQPPYSYIIYSYIKKKSVCKSSVISSLTKEHNFWNRSTFLTKHHISSRNLKWSYIRRVRRKA